MTFDPPDPEPSGEPAWEPPGWEPLAPTGPIARRRTYSLAIATIAAWMSFGANQVFIAYLLRRRTAAWRAVVERGADQANISAAQLADDHLRLAVNLSYVLIVPMFVIGGLWVHGVVTTGKRCGVPAVEPVKTAVQFAIPIIGIGSAIRELIRISIMLRIAGKQLAQWLNTMFIFFFVWLGCYVLQRLAAKGPGISAETVTYLQLQWSLAAFRSLWAVGIVALAVRAILHTDRSMRTAPPFTMSEPLPLG